VWRCDHDFDENLRTEIRTKPFLPPPPQKNAA
jgi:hypothetical protein